MTPQSARVEACLDLRRPILGWAPQGIVCLALVFGLAWLSGVSAAEVRPGTPLTQVAEVRSLAAERAQEGMPVELTGVVTWFDPVTPLLSLQDDSGGIFIDASSLPFTPEAGDTLRVVGTTSLMGSRAGVLPQRVTKLEGGGLPEAVSTGGEPILSGLMAAQWVEVGGVVRSAIGSGARFEMMLRAGDYSIPVTVDGVGAGTIELGAHVRMRGVCGYQRQAAFSYGAWRLLVPGPEHIEVLSQPPADPLDIPVVSLDVLRNFRSGNAPARILHVQGTVTFQQGDDTFFIQDETGGVWVQPAIPVQLTEGQRVSVTGWLDTSGASVAVGEARLRMLGSAPLPKVQPATGGSLFQGDHNYQLVKVSGRFMRLIQGEADYFLDVDVGGKVVVGVLEEANGEPPEIELHSQIELTGVNWITQAGDEDAPSYLVMLRSPADIRILSGPPWWTVRKALMALAIATVLGGGALLWTLLLGRQVAKQTALIREQVSRENALRDRYAALVQNINDGIVLQDPSTGRLLEVNDRMLALYGYTREEMLQLDFGALSSGYAPYDRPHAMQYVGKAMGGAPQLFQWHAKTKEGRLFWVEVNMCRAPIEGTDYCLVALRDITERIAARNELARSQARHQDFVDNFQGIAYQADTEDFNLLFMAGRVEEISGYGPQDFLEGRVRWKELILPEDRERVRAAFEPLLCEAGLVADIEYQIRHHDGSIRWVRDIARSSFSSPESPLRLIHGAVHDITPRKEAEMSRWRLEEQLRQAQKMEAIGQLASGVAHDFNNILTVIQGNVTLLTSEPRERPKEEGDSLKEIQVAAERAASLTRQLLLFSRKKEIQLQAVNLNTLTVDLARMLRRILGEDIDLELRLQDLLPTVKADRGMIEQVLLNLAVNARDAMPGGGRLRIETSADLVPGEGGASAPEWVCLVVEDCGCGIPKEDLSRIFEPFFTTKDVGQGTGLGLATVYGIVEQHGGKLEVESEVGQGTRFRIQLPAIEDSADGDTATQLAPRSGSSTVLVVEDEASVRLLVKKVLERHGYRVVATENGQEAVRIGRESNIRFDLVLTDMVMPGGMSGPDVVSKLRARHSDLEAVYMSGYTSRTAGADEEFREGENFLQKPFSPNELVKIVQRRLESSV